MNDRGKVWIILVLLLLNIWGRIIKYAIIWLSQ